MGQYKDEKGTTRIGDILRGMGDIGKPILSAAGSLTGQSWLNAIADGIKSSSDIKGEQQRALFEVLKLDNDDRGSARVMTTEANKSKYASWLPKNMSALLAIVTTLMVGFMIWGLMVNEIPDSNEPIVYALVGTVSTAWLACIYFWVGSSKGSADKTVGMISRLK